MTVVASRAGPAPAPATELVAVRGISKAFGHTRALHQVSLAGHAGSVHAITGENGAGKSTLMKLLAGVHQPDAGELLLRGQPVRLHSLDPRQACGRLSVGEQQLVEIAKGVSTDASVFIFDEPTAPLNRAEVDQLEALIQALKAQGKLVFYISHRLDEIFRLCDTVTVLKDGQWVATEPIAALSHDRLITLMVGRPLQALFPPRAPAPEAGAQAPLALDVRRLTPRAGGASAVLQLRRGEIVGMGGLEGQGQREIVRALAGVLRPHDSDVVRTGRQGEALAFDPRDGVVRTVQQGVGLIPEDRKLEGLYLELPIADNMWLGALRGLGLVRDLAQDAGDLSGGNQQKVMIGRWLAAGVDTLLIEQPTRGVDVGAKAEIYGLLREFVAQGGAVLALSSDLLELIGLCDRILVVRAGAVVGNVPAASATEAGLLALALTDRGLATVGSQAQEAVA
ncbi:MAG: ABC transporter ATP-binding protein [Burkholderiales bacterium PBB5]|nr:MAG: ABC transporter ATP-binding protein [Burkholderiales bacterium PBB5]